MEERLNYAKAAPGFIIEAALHRRHPRRQLRAIAGATNTERVSCER